MTHEVGGAGFEPDLWPGELPFTAFGQHGEDALDLRVFDQAEWWVDRHGASHRIRDMPADYAANVVRHLEDNADYFFRASCDRWRMQAAGDDLLGRHASSQAARDRLERLLTSSSSRWLEVTPLMRALRKRAAIGPPSCEPSDKANRVPGPEGKAEPRATEPDPS